MRGLTRTEVNNLAKQAGFNLNTGMSKDVEGKIPVVTATHDQLDKFARLILQAAGHIDRKVTP